MKVIPLSKVSLLLTTSLSLVPLLGSVRLPAAEGPNWFDQDRRKVHILYVSPEWAKERGKEFNADAYAENLKRAGVAAVELYTKDHHGYTYYISQTGRRYPIDVLGAMLAACHKRGIKLIAYFSVAFDNYASGTHPEWSHVGRDGHFREAGFTRWICLNSPYADFALEQLREIVSGYEIDGLWLDIMPTTWHEFEKIGWWGELPPFCYCIFCRQRYKAEYGRDIPLDPDREESLNGYRFRVNAARRFLERAKALLKQYRPNAVLTYNGSGNPEDPLDVGDLVSIEAHPPDYFHESMVVRCAKNGSRPTEVLSAGALSGWDGWDLKPVNMMQLETAIALAHGAGVTLGQQPYPRGGAEPTSFQAFKQVFDWVAKVEKASYRPRGVSDIGLYLSIKSWDAPDLGVPALGETEGLHTALLRDQWQYDILQRLSDLKRYQLVIVGEHRALSDAEVASLREYVREGGKLLVTGLTSLYAENGRKRDNFALADVLGINYVGENRYPHFYGDATPPGLFEGPATIVRPREAQVLSYYLNPETVWTRGTTVLWQDPPPDPTQRYPLLTANRFGQGRALYIAASIGTMILENVRRRRYLDIYPVVLLREALKYLEVRASVETNASGMEVVLNRHDDHYTLHLINHLAGTPMWIADTPRGESRGVEVSIHREKLGGAVRVTEAASDKPVTAHAEGNWLRLEVPAFQGSSILVIK